MCVLRKSFFVLLLLSCLTTGKVLATGSSGMYRWTVELRGYISPETGKAPNVYLWMPEGCEKVKAVMVSQQNMAEEALFKMPSFRRQMAELGVALLWVAPAFSNNWDPSTGCQSIFEEMMAGIAYQSGHPEIIEVPVIPFGHSAQATFPWNFAAWNPQRTLCIISFHGDAPRTNLCGYGTANVEWGRTRNIDGIPGLMVEGEYEWWEARVNPALAFRMMYPESCISFLCDTGRGHFDCSERTADYVARFIRKSMEWRLSGDGTLRKVDPRSGWLAERFRADMPESDGDGKGRRSVGTIARHQPAPFGAYTGDPHDAFWYFDGEMARLTEARYRETTGKKRQYVGFEFQGKPIAYDAGKQGGMQIKVDARKEKGTLHLKAIYTDPSCVGHSKAHGTAEPRIEVISGPIRKVDDTTFCFYPYEAGLDNPRRSFSCWVVAVVDADGAYKGAVQPLNIILAE